jgi:hypothetical protein
VNTYARYFYRRHNFSYWRSMANYMSGDFAALWKREDRALFDGADAGTTG